MNPFRYSISLRLRHPSMDPEAISTALGETPRFSWKAGDRRRTPAGQVLEGLNDTTYWCSESIDGDGFELVYTIGSNLESLESHRSFLTDFCSTGGELEYFIGWYTDGRNTGETFDSDLLRRLADLQIDLAFDVYGLDQSPAPKV
jgi:hypothetical protein